MTQLLEKISSWTDEVANKHIDKMYHLHTLKLKNNCVCCPLDYNNKKIETCLECHFLESAEAVKIDEVYAHVTCKPPTNISHYL